MAQYRTIIGSNGEIRIQKKVLFGWKDVSDIYDAEISFQSEKEAEQKIREWQKNKKMAGKVLKEYKDD